MLGVRPLLERVRQRLLFIRPVKACILEFLLVILELIPECVQLVFRVIFTQFCRLINVLQDVGDFRLLLLVKLDCRRLSCELIELTD